MIPLRQIHLDFHTPDLPFTLAKHFDPEVFQARLRQGHVNSITLTARDHYGHIYYDTKLAARHPQMVGDFLMQEVDACHAINVRCPLYVSVGWDVFSARQHPEWLERHADGSLYGFDGVGQLGPGWRTLCFNTAYVDYLQQQVIDLLKHFGAKVDGLFFDILWQDQCLCDQCVTKMLEAGLDPEQAADREHFAIQTEQQLKHRLTQVIHDFAPGLPIVYNEGNITPAVRANLDDYDHFEIESLPSGQWGYQHFPVTARYTKTLGKPFLGMTGKFQQTWADFGSLKNPAALAYECFLPIAHGGGCSIGDQMYPDGTLQDAAYQEIGQVYAAIEQLEPALDGQVSTADVAIMHTQINGPSADPIDPALAGATNMLNEAHYQFDIIDDQTPLDAYRVVILPDTIRLSAALAARLADYRQAGGKLLLTYHSGLLLDQDEFAEFTHLHALGETAMQPTYVRLQADELGAALAQRELVLHGSAFDVASPDKRLGVRYDPLYNRNYQHYYSHYQAPIGAADPAPFGVYDQQLVYLSNDLFTMYKQYGVREYREIVLASLEQLLHYQPQVQTTAPTTADVICNYSAKQHRYLLHYLHYIPTHRAEKLEVIEQATPVMNTEFTLQLPANQHVQAVQTLRQKQTLPFAQAADGQVTFTLPLLTDYEVMAIDLADVQ